MKTSSCELYAQKKIIRPFPPSPKRDDCSCNETKRFSIEKRQHFYPFNNAKRIDFASYEINEAEDTIGKDSAVFYKKLSKIELILSSKYRKLNINPTNFFPSFKERITINSLTINQLTGVFFNLENKGAICSTSCYNPRNAILFYDKNGDLMECISICFECFQNTKSYERIDNQSYWCEQKYWRLKELFKQVGITYGVEE